jgi:hypothetical protein
VLITVWPTAFIPPKLETSHVAMRSGVKVNLTPVAFFDGYQTLLK